MQPHTNKPPQHHRSPKRNPRTRPKASQKSQRVRQTRNQKNEAIQMFMTPKSPQGRFCTYKPSHLCTDDLKNDTGRKEDQNNKRKEDNAKTPDNACPESFWAQANKILPSLLFTLRSNFHHRGKPKDKSKRQERNIVEK